MKQLSHTKANLYSVDFSDAVTANFKNNSVIALIDAIYSKLAFMICLSKIDLL